MMPHITRYSLSCITAENAEIAEKISTVFRRQTIKRYTDHSFLQVLGKYGLRKANNFLPSRRPLRSPRGIGPNLCGESFFCNASAWTGRPPTYPGVLRWVALVPLPTVDFLTSTKLPIFDPSLRTVCGRR